jgi:hypothetical protein
MRNAHRITLVAAGIVSALAATSDARGGGGGFRGGGGGARTSISRPSGGSVNRGSYSGSVNRNTANVHRNYNTANVNRNYTNVNRNVYAGNVNVNRDVDVNGDHGYYRGGGYYGGYPVGGAVVAGAAAGVTAAAIGSVAYSLPPGCGTTYAYGRPYYNCAGTYYQPEYQGTSVNYVVVQPPAG